MAMNNRSETTAMPGCEAESSDKSDARRRIMHFLHTPHLPVAVLASAAVAASAVWLVVGGSWWFPVSVGLSAVCMIAVLSCVYNCWIQRKAVHQSSGWKK
jgi:hypothetical protein